jgi:hypothetical protein
MLRNKKLGKAAAGGGKREYPHDQAVHFFTRLRSLLFLALCKKMKRLCIVALFIPGMLHAQGHTVAHFSVWKPQAGQTQDFDNGYKQHLRWHQLNKDTWSWYGWYVLSGPRNGLFIDATFNHAWSDFDHPVNPAGDAADNALHTEPFASFLGGYKMVFLPRLSTGGEELLQSKFLRIITLMVTDIEAGKALLEKWKEQAAPPSPFQVYKMADGGNLNQLQLLFGYSSFEALGTAENLAETLMTVQAGTKNKVIDSITAETLVFKPDMSLLANRPQ